MAEAAESSQITITLPDGSAREFAGSVTGAEIAADIGPGLAKAALAIKIDGRLADLAATVERGCEAARPRSRRHRSCRKLLNLPLFRLGLGSYTLERLLCLLPLLLLLNFFP